MDCACHGEPMLWNNDSRYKAGGFWRCAVKKRASFARWYANDENADGHLKRKRDRYDTDPIHRIGKRLHDDARRRADTLKRRREAHGALPLEGFNRPSLEQHSSEDHTAA